MSDDTARQDGEVYHCDIHDVETESRGQMQQHIDHEHSGGAAKDTPEEFHRADGGVDRCEECDETGVPLRNIIMFEKIRKMLCKECFKEALAEGRVSPVDPRVDETTGRRR